MHSVDPESLDPYAEIQELSKTREDIRALRDEFLGGLLKSPPDTSPPKGGFLGQEEAQEAAQAAVLFRRAKHLAWHLGQYTICVPEPDTFPPWPTPTVRSTGAVSLSIGSTPVFLAAHFLRARLGHVQGHYCQATQESLYRILAELYTIRSDSTRIGSASADRTDHVSTCVTAECGRSLLQMRRGIRTTRRFLSELKALFARCEECAEQAASLDIGIRNEVEKRLTIELHDLLYQYLGSVHIPVWRPDDLPDPEEVTFESVKSSIITAINRFIQDSSSASTSATESAEAQMNSEAAADPPPKGPAAYFRKLGNQMAYDFLSTGLRRFREASTELLNLKTEVDPNPHIDLALKLCVKLERDLGEHLRTVSHQAEGLLHQMLHYANTSADQRAYENLLFAAETYGAISQSWDKPALSLAVEAIVSSLDHHGLPPRGDAILQRGSGLRGYVPVPYVIHSLAHLIQRVSPEYALRYAKQVRAYVQSRDIRPQDASLFALALNRVAAMLNAQVKRLAGSIVRIRPASSLRGPALRELKWGDLGIDKRASVSGFPYRSLCADLVRLRNGLRPEASTTDLNVERVTSLVFHGPPGTGKSALLKAVARSARADFVEVSASDFLALGHDRVVAQATRILKTIAALTNTVVLFDEVESIFARRIEPEDRKQNVASQFDLLTGSLLPELSSLYSAAQRNGVVYGIATNYVDRVDPAAIRGGRFDGRRCVFFPDVASKLFYLKRSGFSDSELMEALRCVPFASFAQLMKSKWFEMGKEAAVDWGLPEKEWWGYACDKDPEQLVVVSTAGDLESSVLSEERGDILAEIRNLLNTPRVFPVERDREMSPLQKLTKELKEAYGRQQEAEAQVQVQERVASKTRKRTKQE